MKVCLDELTSNLSKVELRVHRHNKTRREEIREITGRSLEPIPEDVLNGYMNEELYNIECRLHREAGIPAPPPWRGSRRPAAAVNEAGAKRVGLLLFSDIVKAVREQNNKVRSPQ